MENIIYITEDDAWEYMDHPLDVRIGQEHRWYTDKYYVFEKGGLYWEFLYMSPATEDQDGQDCWEDPDNIPCHRVVPKEIVKRIYVRVK